MVTLFKYSSHSYPEMDVEGAKFDECMVKVSKDVLLCEGDGREEGVEDVK